MSSSFSFNLKNDDIEYDASDGDEPVSRSDVHESSKAPAAESKLHILGNMVRSLALLWHRTTYHRLRSMLSDSSSKKIQLCVSGF